MAIVVKSYSVFTSEDVHGKGCDNDRNGSWWDSTSLPVDGDFQTAKEALKAVAEANGWNAEKIVYEFDDFNGEFSFALTVTDDNAEASEADFKAWEAGKKRLWVADVAVSLVYREERELTESERAL